LATSLPAMQWVVNAYTLLLSAGLLIGGAAGDRFGRRRVFILGIAVFVAASIACGLAPGVVPLILARAVQGSAARSWCRARWRSSAPPSRPRSAAAPSAPGPRSP